MIVPAASCSAHIYLYAMSGFTPFVVVDALERAKHPTYVRELRGCLPRSTTVSGQAF